MRCPIHTDNIINEDVNNKGYYCIDCEKYYSKEECKKAFINLGLAGYD